MKKLLIILLCAFLLVSCDHEVKGSSSTEGEKTEQIIEFGRTYYANVSGDKYEIIFASNGTVTMKVWELDIIKEQYSTVPNYTLSGTFVDKGVDNNKQAIGISFTSVTESLTSPPNTTVNVSYYDGFFNAKKSDLNSTDIILEVCPSFSPISNLIGLGTLK